MLNLKKREIFETKLFRYKKISRLDRKVAIIAFSIEEVYAIAELVRRQKGCSSYNGFIKSQNKKFSSGFISIW